MKRALLLLLALGLTLLLIGCSQDSSPRPADLEALVAESDDVMQSLSSFRSEYFETGSDKPVSDLRPAKLVTVLRPDSQCALIPGRSGKILREVIDLGPERWIRPPNLGADIGAVGAWVRSDDWQSIPELEFENLRGGLIEGVWPPGGTGPHEFRLAGEETIDGRKAWIVSYEYSMSTIEGGYVEVATLWIDRETSHLLRKELINNDPWGWSGSTRVWVYSDFDLAVSIEPPEPILTPRPGGVLRAPTLTPEVGALPTSTPQAVGRPCGVDLSDHVVLSLSMDKTPYVETYLIGEPVELTAHLLQGEEPLLGAEISALVGTPGGGSYSIVLYDDGSNGDLVAGDGAYFNTLRPTVGCGTHPIELSASVTIAGERVVRELGRQASVREPTGTYRFLCR